MEFGHDFCLLVGLDGWVIAICGSAGSDLLLNEVPISVQKGLIVKLCAFLSVIRRFHVLCWRVHETASWCCLFTTFLVSALKFV
jgi:hypothetical protein